MTTPWNRCTECGRMKPENEECHYCQDDDQLDLFGVTASFALAIAAIVLIAAAAWGG